MSKATFAYRTLWIRKVFTSLTLGAFLFATHAPAAFAQSSWGPTLLVNTESFQSIDDGDGTTDIELRFGTSGRELKYNITSGEVDLDTSLNVTGDVDATGDVHADGALTATGDLAVDGDAFLNGKLTVGDTITVGGVEYTFPGSDGSNGDVLSTNSAGTLTWVAQTAQRTQEEIEDFVGAMVDGNTETLISVDYQDGDGTLDFVVDSQVIIQSEIDTQAELEGIIGDATNILDVAEIDTHAEFEALAGGLNYILDSEIDTQAELEAILTDATNVIDVAEIDTQAELEALVSDATNFIDVAEINSEAEIEAIVGVDFLKGIEIDTEAELEGYLTDVSNVITEAEIDTEAELEALANVDFLTEADVDTQAELEAILTDATNVIDVAEIDSQAELEAILADATNVIDVAEIDTQAELEALVSDATNLIDVAEIDSEAEIEAIAGVNFFVQEEVDDRVDALLQEGAGVSLTYDDGANTLTIAADSIFNSSGSSVGLTPEYAGATYYEDGSDNTGQLVLDYDSTNKQNFYKWTSSKSSLNDYNIAIRVRVPENFSAWDGEAPVEFTYRTNAASSADNKVTMTMLDTDGTARPLTGAADLANTSWTTATITGPEAGGTFTPGEYITIIVQMFARNTNSGEAHAGYINLNWDTTTP